MIKPSCVKVPILELDEDHDAVMIVIMTMIVNMMGNWGKTNPAVSRLDEDYDDVMMVMMMMLAYKGRSPKKICFLSGIHIWENNIMMVNMVMVYDDADLELEAIMMITDLWQRF